MRSIKRNIIQVAFSLFFCYHFVLFLIFIGISIHTFHGNFFVRSTDLLSLPNVNPDAGFGMQMSIEEQLTEMPNMCFQAALLYTSSKGKITDVFIRFCNFFTC